ncbi:uncharacterized protein F4822DRAFT_387083 [Hypoxylon trugodes]|uniref:uncharacterized protein n=1 Tax=Hypoxylon trugodes TaxID=326681 RepID=UPI00219B1A29|nr:uncharacterized protein F4822DRAFT_387083 [Hypoxylon trugodes]KAI1394106.1 hypothetical protein F4822DRAFT_387083 [Hypoxylon trugodes]
MLLRQLQRPSSRSVAAVAKVWRPTFTALLHGSSRQPQFTHPSSSSQHNSEDDAKSPNKPLSLFERLFPEEAKQARNSTDSKWPKKPRSQLSNTDDESSPLTVAEDEHFFQHRFADAEYLEFSLDGELDLPENENDTNPDTASLRAKTMLILSAASKQLSLSDFQGLGPRGAHVEGWVGVGGGAARVVPARDPDTLQPLGHYFILFDSHDAAVAYRDEVERLWELGKARLAERDVYNGEREKDMRGRAVERRPLVRGDEDVDVALKSFTLVPPSQRYHLELSSGRGNMVDDLDSGGGSFVDQLAARAGSRHLVLVTVDGGRISVDTLRQAIEEDGVERNLPWRVTDLENGILPFGKSVLKKHDRTFEQSLLDQTGQAVGETNVDENREGAEVVDDKKYRRYPRFIIPFEDAAEAQRFVRGWHRRQFKLRMSIEENEDKQVNWDEIRTLNTSVLW